MGMTWNDIAALRNALDSGVRFDRTLTLGRQWLLTDEADLLPLLDKLPIGEKLKKDFLAAHHPWGDELFRLLGANQVDSLDYSAYEGVAIVHDLNTPIPDHLRGQYDFVYDGGTSEHVFNVCQVYKNMMEMTKLNGHLLICVPANNRLGHGFYQFSPEFFYRVLSPENGFEIVRLVLTEDFTRRRYEAADPAKAGRRIEIFGTAPRLILSVLAKRVAEVPIFAKYPQQSDYVAAWSKGGHEAYPTRPRSRIRAVLVAALTRCFPKLLSYFRHRRSMDLRYHPHLFRLISDD